MIDVDATFGLRTAVDFPSLSARGTLEEVLQYHVASGRMRRTDQSLEDHSIFNGDTEISNAPDSRQSTYVDSRQAQSAAVMNRWTDDAASRLSQCSRRVSGSVRLKRLWALYNM